MKRKQSKINPDRIRDLLMQIALYKETISRAQELLKVMKDHESPDSFAKRKEAREKLIKMRMSLPRSKYFGDLRTRIIKAIDMVDEYSLYSYLGISNVEKELKKVYRELCDQEELLTLLGKE